MTCGADLQRIFMFILGFNKNPGKNNPHTQSKKSENPQTAHTLAGAGLAQSQSH